MKCKLNFEGVINPNEFGGLLYSRDEKDAVDRVLLQEKIFRYATEFESETTKFEKNICKKFHTKYALGLNNGTSALKVALRALGIKENDRVLVSSYTFLSTATSVLFHHAIPVPMDFDFEYGINLTDLESELKKGAKAVIVVHLQGRCFNIQPVIKLAKKYHAFVIEDACQAFGASYKGKYAGTFADIGVYSFQQNKQLTSGEGGLLITNNKAFYQIARNYQDMGSVRDVYPSWENEQAIIGDNYRMNNIQAAILNAQLQKLDDIIDKQKSLYNQITLNIDEREIIKPLDEKGFTGQNILVLMKDSKHNKEIVDLADSLNAEVRKIWDKTYDNRMVFIREKLNANDLKKHQNLNAINIANNLLSISVPPILSKKDVKVLNRILKVMIDKNKSR